MIWWHSWGLNPGLQVMSLEFFYISLTCSKYAAFNFMAVFCLIFCFGGRTKLRERGKPYLWKQGRKKEKWDWLANKEELGGNKNIYWGMFLVSGIWCMVCFLFCFPWTLQQTSVPQFHCRVGALFMDLTEMLRITSKWMRSGAQTVTAQTVTVTHLFMGLCD